MAAQLTATKGRPERRLARCMARASSSFPVPLAPWMNTLAGDRAVRGQDDDGQHRRLLADLVEQRKPVHAAHLEVGDDELRARRGERGQRLFAAVHRLNSVARGGQAQRHELQNIRIVVDEKNRVHFGRACSRSMILRSIAFSASSCSFSCAARRCSRRRSLIWA